MSAEIKSTRTLNKAQNESIICKRTQKPQYVLRSIFPANVAAFALNENLRRRFIAMSF